MRPEKSPYRKAIFLDAAVSLTSPSEEGAFLTGVAGQVQVEKGAGFRPAVTVKLSIAHANPWWN